LLLLAGFSLVLVGTVGFFYAVGSNDPPWRQVLLNLTPPVAYGLIGWAWWQWADFAQANPVALNVHRRTSRIVATGTLILSVVYLDSLYRMVRFHLDHPGTFSHYLLGVASNAVEALGFCITALGFWLSSRISGRAGDSLGDVAPRDEASVDVGVN
jgi:hypothetical protein